ncbi:DUF58 domain-containing protein [Puniceicoccaceae bacterium K14]|nr:DUF58 domain-containing protein [Puniceicoccaceae bacterium K14]
MSDQDIQKLNAGSSISDQVAMLRRLQWRVRHTVESVLSGEYKSSFRGKGMEFDQVVKYEFGDDVRDIDWNVTARLGEPYRKKFIEEREITLLLLFEDSPSLQFGSGGVSKREALMELASLIMLLSSLNGDRISLMYCSPNGFDYQKSLNGRGRIMHAASSLLSQPKPEMLKNPHSQIPWKYVAKAAPRHSVFVWLGDFGTMERPSAWNIIRKRYQPLGFRIEDPWERNLPKSGSQSVFDPLSGSLFTLNGKSKTQRDAHQEWVNQRDESFKELFPKQADRLTLAAGEDPLDSVVKLFHTRMQQYAQG